MSPRGARGASATGRDVLADATIKIRPEPAEVQRRGTLESRDGRDGADKPPTAYRGKLTDRDPIAGHEKSSPWSSLRIISPLLLRASRWVISLVLARLQATGSPSVVGVSDRYLVLLRHGKSGYPDGVADHGRPLAPRGVREAGLAGDWLRANLPALDVVLCSSATRARQTLQRTGINAPVRYVERLYGASPGTMLDEINQVGDDIGALLVVGHEPTMSAVAVGLAGADGTDSVAVERISAKFPTSGIAVLRLAGRWVDLEPGGAALVEFHVPR